ncbi:MAG: hypothetical protein RL662_994 [Bacteroidota bacterium]|jgi:uncharacterized membrane protein
MMIEIVEHLATGISVLSLSVIIYGIGNAVIDFVKNEFSDNKHQGIRKIRANFGSYLLLGLELLIAADIIKTVVEPSYEELIVLAGVVVLRTILSVFLNREIKELE